MSVGWGFAPDPTGGAYSDPPDLLAGLRRPTSKGRGREGKGREGEERGNGREGKGREGEGRDLEVPPPQVNFLDPPTQRKVKQDTDKDAHVIGMQLQPAPQVRTTTASTPVTANPSPQKKNAERP